MPIYSHTCPAGHTTDTLWRASSGPRPDVVTCPLCGEPARYTIAAPAAGIVAGSSTPCSGGPRDRKSRDTGPGLRVVDWTCADGHADFDVFTDTDTVTLPPCATCGKPTRRVWAMPSLDWFTAAYPNGYHEPQLGFERDADGNMVLDDDGHPVGLFIRDRAHFEQVCKEMGVVPVAKDEGIRMEEDQLRADADKAAEEDAEVARMLAQNEWGPEAAQMKSMRDNGLVADWTKHAKNLGVPLSHQN